MSDEIKKEEMTSEEAFSEEIRRRLAQPGSGKPSLEEFKLMVYKDRERRRKKRNVAVAGIVVALLAGFFAFDTLAPEVGADKNPKEEIITEDGVIIEDGGYGASNESEQIIIVEKWEKIAEIKTKISNLPVPEYIPERYIFRQLKVLTVNATDKTCEYTFESSAGEILEIECMVLSSGETSLDINEVSRSLPSNRGKIYLQKNKTATTQLDDGIILHIWGNVNDNEIVRIVNEISN